MKGVSGNTGYYYASDVNGYSPMFRHIYVCRSAAKDDYKEKNLLFNKNGVPLTFLKKPRNMGIDDADSSQGALFDMTGTW